MLSICAATEACAPWPMLTMAITAETPMMMPSIVNAARILLRSRARKATRMIIKRFIIFIHRFRRLRRLSERER